MRRTIRFQITAVAAALSAVLLVAVSFLMITVLREQLTDNLDEGLQQRADAIEAAIDDKLLTELSADEDLLVQIVDRNGVVVAASTSMAGAAPIVPPEPGLRTIDEVPGHDEVFRVLVREIDSDRGPIDLIVGIDRDDITEPINILSQILTLTVPAVVLVLGVLTWWLTGRTLRPVEKMRIELAQITGTNFARRVGEPGTGDEIDRLASTMNQTLDRLEGAIRRQHRFVADASHELRTPLARIRTELELDLAAATPEPATTERSVLDAAVELQHLVDDLLQLARSDDGLSETSLEPVDLDDIVLREARRLRERARVGVDTHGVSAAHTSGDAAQLTRAVRNLLENAERHAASSVTIALAEVDDHIRLTVSDDGAGIAPEARQLIFERFTRLDDARTRDAGGTGLGLAIVRDVVQRHGGTVSLDDGPVTRFVVVLPQLA